MLRLTDSQMAVLMRTAGQLERSKRDAFLQRLSAELVVRRGVRKPTDADLEHAMRAVLGGLVQESAA
jgi:hypothetical protein